MKRRFLELAGLIGFLGSTIAAIYAGFDAFLHPFNESSSDNVWAVFFAAILIAVGFLVWIGASKLLIKLTFLGLSIVLLLAILFAEQAKSMFLLVWLIILSASIGAKIVSWLSPSTKVRTLEWLLFSISLGFGFLSLLVFALGVLGYLHWVVAYGLVVGLTIFLLPGLLKDFLPQIQSYKLRAVEAWHCKDLRLLAFGFSVFTVCLLGPFIWSLAPAIRFDSVVYHIGIPEIYIQNRAMVEVVEPLQAYLAHYSEMLYTLGLLLDSQPLPTLIHFITGLLSAGLTFLFGRRVGGFRVGLFAMLLFYALPIMFESGTAHNDLFSVLYGFGTVYAVYAWWQDKRDGWLAVAGLMAGFALGTKLNVAVLYIPMGIFLLIGLFNRFGFSWRSFRGLLYLGVPALLLFAPWAVRDWLWTGNPVFPFFNNVFQSTQFDEVSNLRELSGSRMVLDLLSFPWVITMDSKQYYPKSAGDVSAGLFLLALPWNYFTAKFDKKDLRIKSLGLLLFSFAVVCIFLYSTHLVRYLMPLFPVLAVLAALNIEAFWLLLSNSKWKHIFSGIALGIAFVFFLSTRLAFTVFEWQIVERYPINILLGRETSEEFLTRNLQPYDALQYLNQNGGRANKVLSMGSESRTYTTSQINSPFFSPKIASLVFKDCSQEEFAGVLKEQGYNYLLLDFNVLRKSPESYLSPNLSDSFLEKYTQLEFARNNVYVYRLFPEMKAEASEGENLLKNAGFENTAILENQSEWVPFGEPAFDSAIDIAYTGTSALHATDQSYVYQVTGIEPDTLYTLGQWVRADSEGQQARLQIMWLDRANRMVHVSIDVVPAGESWEWRQMSVTAPDDAVTARIYAQAHDGSQVWIDDLCFAKGDSCK